MKSKDKFKGKVRGSVSFKIITENFADCTDAKIKAIINNIEDGIKITAWNAIPFNEYSQYNREVILPYKKPFVATVAGISRTPKNELPQIKVITIKSIELKNDSVTILKKLLVILKFIKCDM